MEWTPKNDIKPQQQKILSSVTTWMNLEDTDNTLTEITQAEKKNPV